MTERENGGIVIGTGRRSARSKVLRWIFALATFAALVFALAETSQAQSQGAAPKAAQTSTITSTKVAVIDTAAVTQVATPKPVAGPAAPTGQTAPKGQHEGIAVHGHWIIDVRNPDGKLVTHREFENALVTGTSNDGAAFLASLLGRVVTPGSWQIYLFIAGNGTSLATLAMDISEPGSTAAAICPGSTSTFTCSSTLSLTGPNVDNDLIRGETLTLAGSGPVPSDLSTAASPPQITLVQTNSITCANGPSVTPASCSTSAPVPDPLAFSFTSRNLDGNTPAGAAAGDPNPVPVTPGQTVQVTVVFSFQ